MNRVTIMVLNFRTNRSEQSVDPDQTAPRGSTLFAIPCDLLDALLMVEPLHSNFRRITANFSGVRIFRNFTVYKEVQV